MRSFLSQFLLVAILLAVVAMPGTAQIPAAQQAPSFELPLLNGSGYVRSDELFFAHQQTILVFWDSGCPHCVESLLECEMFHSEQTSGEIALIGIHADQGDISEVFEMIEANGITFPQLWDLGGETGQRYGIALTTFTLFLVDRTGNITAQQSEPQGNMTDILDRMLEQHEKQNQPTGDLPLFAPGEQPQAPSSHDFVFHGEQRISFLGIDALGVGAAGPYGETARTGNNLLFRFELEMSRRINKHLRVGGLLRISNEGEEVLEAGPQYLTSEWGSAFAEISVDRFLFRAGYYEINMTPLTLMRWDWNDNPRIGGDAGCGCGAVAGILLVESLEELNPELIFEGGVATYRRSGLEARAFYAIPRRAKQTSYLEVRSTGADWANYSLEIYGIESTWRRYDRRTDSFYKFGVHFTGSWENSRSVDFTALGFPAPLPWDESMVITTNWSIPLVRSVGIEGEWVIWNRARVHGLIGRDEALTTRGKGGIVGAVFEKEPGWKLRCDYIRLDDEFYSPFAALSYQPNREGFRLSADAPLSANALVASVFYKRLREIEQAESDAEKGKSSFFGASLDAELPNGLGGSIGWLDNGLWRKGSSNPSIAQPFDESFDEVRQAVIAGVRYRFNKNSTIQIQYQRIDGSIKRGNIEDEALTNLYSIYLSARF
jgi:hypothetical protein